MIFCSEGAAGARKAGARQSAQGAQMRFQEKEKKKRQYMGMDSQAFAQKWKSVFAGEVPREIVEQRIDGRGCYLWHAFSWGNAPCVERGAADAAFDAADKDGAFIAEEYAFHGGGKNIEYFFRKCPLGLKSADLADMAEVFVVGRNFRWTYVVTHETGCGLGPYFAERPKGGK